MGKVLDLGWQRITISDASSGSDDECDILVVQKCKLRLCVLLITRANLLKQYSSEAKAVDQGDLSEARTLSLIHISSPTRLMSITKADNS